MTHGLWTPFNEEKTALLDDARAQVAHAKQLTRELKQIDPYLELVFVGDRSPDYPGITPGRWHVRRSPEDGPDSYWAVNGPDGEYVEPSSKLIEDMKAADLWRQGALQELYDRKARAETKKKREQALASEQRVDVMAESLRAAGRLPGYGGMRKRKWGKGGVVGS